MGGYYIRGEGDEWSVCVGGVSDEWSVVRGRGEGDEWQRRSDMVELQKSKWSH